MPGRTNPPGRTGARGRISRSCALLPQALNEPVDELEWLGEKLSRPTNRLSLFSLGILSERRLKRWISPCTREAHAAGKRRTTLRREHGVILPRIGIQFTAACAWNGRGHSESLSLIYARRQLKVLGRWPEPVGALDSRRDTSLLLGAAQ